MRKILIYILLIAVVLISCKKDDDGAEDNGQGVSWSLFDGKLSLISGNAMVVDASQNIAIAGSYNGKFQILKLNQDGQLIWEKNIGTDLTDEAKSITLTPDNGYVVVGNSTSFLDSKIYVLRLNSLGETQWSKTYGWSDVDVSYCVTRGAENNYVLCGTTQKISGKDAFGDVYVIKFNDQGDTLWTRIYEDSGEEIAYCIQPSPQTQGFIITGRDENNDNKDVLLMSIGPDGDLNWKKSFGGSSWEEGFNLTVNPSGEIAVCGFSQSQLSQAYVIKVSADGNLVWENYYGTEGFYEKGLCIVPNDGYIISGSQYTVENQDDNIYLLKIGSDGDPQWERTYGKGMSDWGNAVRKLSSGNLVVTGTTMSESAGGNIFFMNTDGEGKQ